MQRIRRQLFVFNGRYPTILPTVIFLQLVTLTLNICVFSGVIPQKINIDKTYNWSLKIDL